MLAAVFFPTKVRERTVISLGIRLPLKKPRPRRSATRSLLGKRASRAGRWIEEVKAMGELEPPKGVFCLTLEILRLRRWLIMRPAVMFTTDPGAAAVSRPAG